MSLHVWRHPRPQGVAGRCIGRTDVPVDARKAKRLARRIQRHARLHGLPRTVFTSPLQRCHGVGRWLRRWGWRHVVSIELIEMDFGTWDGQRWQDIAVPDIDAWCQDFADHAPGGGEPLRHMLQRVAAWSAPQPGCTVVAHAGWMLCRRWAQQHGWVNGALHVPTQAMQWPAAPAYAQHWLLTQRLEHLAAGESSIAPHDASHTQIELGAPGQHRATQA